MSIYVSLIDGMGSATDSSGGSVTTTGAKAGDFAHLTNDIIGSEGIVNGLSVSEHSPANMSVDVSAGTCYVQNDGWSANSGDIKYWRIVSDTVENVSIDSNSSGNPRIDIIVVKIDNTVVPNDEATNVATVEVVKGTPASSPSTPATPSNALLLAEVYVADGATSITDADITDRREYFGGKFDHISITGNKDVVNHSVTPVSGQTLNILEYKDKNGDLDMYMDADGALHFGHTLKQQGENVAYQAAALKVYNSSAINNMADGSTHTVNYDTVIYKYGDLNLNSSTNEIEIGSDGVYRISGYITFNNASDQGIVYIYVRRNDNPEINKKFTFPKSDSMTTAQLGGETVYSAGDKVTITVSPDACGGNLDVVNNPGWTWLSISRVRKL